MPDTTLWADNFDAGPIFVNILNLFRTCGFMESAQDFHFQSRASELDHTSGKTVWVCNSSNTCHTQLYVVMQHYRF